MTERGLWLWLGSIGVIMGLFLVAMLNGTVKPGWLPYFTLLALTFQLGLARNTYERMG